MATKRKTGGGPIPPRALRLERNKARATTKPVARLDQLKGLWEREVAVYLPRVVRVTGRKGSRLSFRLVGTDGVEDTVVRSVDLDDGKVAWGDLPSTAQLVIPGSRNSLGYLFLAPDWPPAPPPPPGPAKRAAVAVASAPVPPLPPGPKYPWGDSL